MGVIESLPPSHTAVTFVIYGLHTSADSFGSHTHVWRPSFALSFVCSHRARVPLFFSRKHLAENITEYIVVIDASAVDTRSALLAVCHEHKLTPVMAPFQVSSRCASGSGGGHPHWL